MMEEVKHTKGYMKTKVEVNKDIWHRLSTWIRWSYLSISGDELTLTVKFGDVSVALNAFKYLMTGKRPPRRHLGEK